MISKLAFHRKFKIALFVTYDHPTLHFSTLHTPSWECTVNFKLKQFEQNKVKVLLNPCNLHFFIHKVELNLYPSFLITLTQQIKNGLHGCQVLLTSCWRLRGYKDRSPPLFSSLVSLHSVKQMPPVYGSVELPLLRWNVTEECYWWRKFLQNPNSFICVSHRQHFSLL